MKNRDFVQELSSLSFSLLIKANSDLFINSIISENVSASLLLLEEFSEEDANKTDAAIKELKKVISDFETQISPLGEAWKVVLDKLKNQAGDLNTKQLAQYSLAGDKKKLAKYAAEYTEKLQTVSAEVAAIISVIQLVKKNLENFKSEVEKEGKQEEKIALLKNSIADFPDLKDLDKGIKSSYKIPDAFTNSWAKGSKSVEKSGFLNKALDFLSNLFKNNKAGSIVSVDELSLAIKESPYGPFTDLNLEEISNKMLSSGEELGRSAAIVTTDGAEAASDKAETGTEAPGTEKLSPEAEKEIERKDKSLVSSAKEAISEPDSPINTINKMLDQWAASLSKTSQEKIRSNNRLSKLKSNVESTIDGLVEPIERSVRAAVQSWREENEETLTKGGSFAKKNFGSLEKIIPQIAGTILKRKNENRESFSENQIKKAVYRYLDSRFKQSEYLFESSRLITLAGLRNGVKK
jgi:chromosome segregation ATPase